VRLVGERVVLRLVRPENADALAEGFADDPTMGAMLGIEPDHENADWLRSTFPRMARTEGSARSTGSGSPTRSATSRSGRLDSSESPGPTDAPA